MSSAERNRQREARSAALRRASRQVRAEWRDGGPRGFAAKALRAAATRLAPPGDELGIIPADVMPRTRPPVPRISPDGGPMSIGWVVGAPSAGSGGHTTLFRLIRGLEQRGHASVVYIYDRHCPGDARTSRSVIDAHFPAMAARVAAAAELEQGDGAALDALVATSWPTAYVVRNAPTGAPRAYLVQDFEPWFYPHGSAAALAEATYRFGFHGIAAGAWLKGLLERDYGMECDHFEFGVDRSVYTNWEGPSRRAVVFYARPCTPRRGFGLGLLALERLAEHRPDIEIHLFGEDLHDLRLPFPCVDHGTLTPVEINELFNACAAGLVLSFTNMSLLPLEMLAAGCVPVVNDAAHNRVVLDNPAVSYVDPEPEVLAEALATAVDDPSRARHARCAAESVGERNWDAAADEVERAISRVAGRPMKVDPDRRLGAPRRKIG